VAAKNNFILCTLEKRKCKFKKVQKLWQGLVFSVPDRVLKQGLRP
jgi:hypothetical protein